MIQKKMKREAFWAQGYILLWMNVLEVQNAELQQEEGRTLL